MARIRKNQYVLEIIETLIVWGVGGTIVATLSGGFSDLVEGETVSAALLLDVLGRMLLSAAGLGVAGVILWAYAAGARALVKQGGCGSWIALALLWGLLFGLVLAIVLDLNTRLIVSRFYLGVKPLSYGLLFKTAESPLRSELQHKIEVYREAMDYLAKCPRFDESAFRRLDGILARAGASFGAAERQEMIRQAHSILPTRTTGGLEELRAQLQISLSQASEGFRRILEETSPETDSLPPPAPAMPAEAVMAGWAAASAQRLGGGAVEVPTADLAATSAGKPSVGSRSTWRVFGIVLLAVIAVCLVFTGLAVFMSDRRPTGQRQVPAETELASAAEAASTKPPPTRAATRTATPEPFAAMKPIPPQAACIYGSRGGLVCMGPDGWQTFEGGEIELGRYDVDAMEVCPDATVLIFTNSLYAHDGLEWHDYGRGDFGSVVDIDCVLQDDIWVAHFSGIGHFDGTTWTDYPLEQILGTQEPDEHPQAVVADGQGGVWAALSKSLAHYDGEEWTFYREGEGLNDTYYFDALARDSQFTPWAVYSRGLLHWDGASWKTLSFPTGVSLTDMVIDTRDRVWVGTNTNVRVYENQQWRSYSVGQGNTSSDRVQTLWVDGQGRVWVGTKWGLTVLDQTGWTTYHMHTSELLDNEIDDVFVVGDGPPLAEPVEKMPGKLRGRVLQSGVGVPGVRVDACVEYVGMMFSGSTPCSGQPFTATTTTDDEGFFTLDDLPTGYYYVTLRTPEGKWKVLSSTLAIGGTDVLVSAGGVTTLEDMEIGSSD
jgi:hypothetical protein